MNMADSTTTTLTVSSQMNLTDSAAVSSNTSDHQLTTIPLILRWANPDDIVSVETQAVIYRVITCGFYQVVNIVGVVVNIINMIVFAKQGLRTDRVNVNLFCLALVDLLNLCFSELTCVSCWLNWSGDSLAAHNWDSLLIGNVLPLYVFFPNVSIGFLTLISVDRCLAVTFPLHANRYHSIRCSLLAMLVTAVLIFAPYIPVFFFYNVIWAQEPITGRPLVMLRPTKVAFDSSILAFRDAFNMILKCGCFTVVLVSTITTIIVLRRASKMRALMKAGGEGGKESRVKSADIKITVMLIAVAVIMEICLVLDLAFGITIMTVPEFFLNRKLNNLFSVCQSFLFLARAINSAANFFCYLALSTSFRTTLQSLGPCRITVSKERGLRLRSFVPNTSLASETVVSDMASAS